ncbi:MAG: ATP-binding protein [Bacteroidota bacterium]
MKVLLHILLPVCLLGSILNSSSSSTPPPDYTQLSKKVEWLDRLGHRDSSYALLQEAQSAGSYDDSANYLLLIAAITEHYKYYGEMDSLRRYADQLLQLSESQGNRVMELKALLFQTHQLLWNQRYQQALRHCEQAISISRELNDPALEGLSLYCMGMTLRRTRDQMKYPLDYFHRAYTIFEQEKDTTMMIRTALMITSGMTDAQQDNSEWLKHAIHLSDHYPHIVQRIGVLNVWAASVPPQQAIPLLQEALIRCQKTRMKDYERHIYLQLCNRYQALQQYEKALEHLRLGINAADTPLHDAPLYYYHIYKDMGQWERAIEYNEQYRLWEREQKNIQIQSLVSEWETRLNIKEKEWQLEQQQELLIGQKWRNRLFLIILVLSLLAMGLAFWAYFSQWKARKRLSRQKNIIEQQACELRKLDKLKSNFFANASHELRTPLTLMLGPISSILKRNQLSNHDFTLMSIAQQNGHQLLKLVNEILDLNKLEAGKMQLQESNVLFYPFVRRILASFESFAEKKGISIHYNYQSDRNLKLRLDIDKFETILNNLLANSLKFTEKNGRITITISDQDDYAKLEVVDSGRGIHPEDLPYIFDRFYQTTRAEAPVESGTGIGLAICREFATLLKGRIYARSTLGKGSHFTFEFPKQEVMGATVSLSAPLPKVNSERAHPLARSSTIGPDKPTLLIVEDSYSLRDYLQYILNYSYHTVAVENGQLALDILSNQAASIDLIISDVMMPIMDGIQLLKLLKSRDYFCHIPVIMLTARAESRDRLRALRIGVDDYLIKPFVEEELLARIENLLRNHQFRKLAQQQPEDAGPPPPSVSAIDQEWLLRLEQVIDNRLGQFGLTAEEVAHEMAVSRSQLFRQLKRLTGLTPAQYLIEARLNKARKLLENRHQPTVKAVAYEVGFRQAKHFSRQFKKRFGKLPSAYLV